MSPLDLPTSKEKVSCKFCGSLNVVKNGLKKQEQYWFCNDCYRGFMNNDALPRMRYRIKDIARILSMFYSGISLPEIKSNLFRQIDLYPSYSTLYGWILKFTKLAIESVNSDHPRVSREWIIFRDSVSIGGQKYWILDIVDIKTQFLLATLLSDHTSISEIDHLLNIAISKAGLKPKIIFTDLPCFSNSDSMWLTQIRFAFSPLPPGYQKNSRKTFADISACLSHRSVILRALKTLETARLIIAGWDFHYNYVYNNSLFQSQTPSKLAQTHLVYLDWEELIKTQSSKKVKKWSKWKKGESETSVG